MEHFHPGNLDRLEISMHMILFYDWIEDITLEIVLKLASRLSTIKLLSTKFQESDREMNFLFSGFPTKLDMFHQILSALKVNKS